MLCAAQDGCGVGRYSCLRWNGALMVLMQNAEAGLSWSRLFVNVTEASGEFEVLARGKKE